jgi:hypothetical protein
VQAHVLAEGVVSANRGNISDLSRGDCLWYMMIVLLHYGCDFHLLEEI